ncbi:MAG: SpvB/TcaC N-terminal domain-containing protein, partial [Chitinophagales bacterium]
MIFFNAELIFSQSTNYTPLYTNSTFTKTINTGLPVGTIGAKSDVANGAANYTVPIVIPPGTNGVQPNLAISYNSSGGDGILGKGWGLSGLSVISRITHSIYYDGETEPVELLGTDRFALDGQRLISKTGNYGSNGATYGAEMENFATVTSYGSYGNGPSWFKVETKDGVVMEYGNSSDSKFTNSSNSTVIYWRLNKVIYKDGNYMQFSYSNYTIAGSKESRINQILYTGNAAANLQPYNSIN